ncbi:MAG: VTT domain-containing protein [Chloroflexi bacterium]|nr:VTT domain-containing protein [Chloroflexota bacterium]
MPDSLSLLNSHPLTNWAYVLLLVLVAIEGPIATLVAAVAASAGYLNPLLVFVFAATGNAMADLMWYLLGYLGKTEWVIHHGRWLGIRPEQVKRWERDMHTHVSRILFTAKLTLGFMVPMLIAAGLARVPWRRWLGVLLVAETIWTGGLVLAGFYFGAQLRQLEQGLQWLALGGGLLFIILAGWYLARQRTRTEETIS